MRTPCTLTFTVFVCDFTLDICAKLLTSVENYFLDMS
jgi:hypothetical protein